MIVYRVYNGYWFFGRPTVEELRQDLRAVLMKHHWDWDLSAVEVRAAWERGEIERFYPPELGWPQDASGPTTGCRARTPSGGTTATSPAG